MTRIKSIPFSGTYRNCRRPFLAAVLIVLVNPSVVGAAPAADPASRDVTILYTTDFHSAFDPIPVLAANVFYKGTTRYYSRPYTLLERNGIRVAVIGIIGQDARSVALPSGITDLEFTDPIPAVRAAVRELKPRVDLVVVLAHQGKTGPQQSDAEARPEVQRDFDEDIRLCGEVEGIDVFVGGHAHRGIETPFVHPKTGTLIVQTYGYGTRLGYLKLRLRDGK